MEIGLAEKNGVADVIIFGNGMETWNTAVVLFQMDSVRRTRDSRAEPAAKQIQPRQPLTWMETPSAARVKSSAAAIVHLNVPLSFGRANTSRGPFKSKVLNPGNMGKSTLIGMTAAILDVSLGITMLYRWLCEL